MKGDELAERLLGFAARVVLLSARLGRVPDGRHLAGQLVKAGTSVGAHYEEARGAESRADFIHKLGIALKECRETCYWLSVIKRTDLLRREFPEDLLSEAEQLCSILGQSIVTARRARRVKGGTGE